MPLLTLADLLSGESRHAVFLLQVMEQLLRLIPDIRHIFVMVRSRPGLSGEILSAHLIRLASHVHRCKAMIAGPFHKGKVGSCA